MNRLEDRIQPLESAKTALEAQNAELQNHLASVQQLYIDSKRINEALEEKLEAQTNRANNEERMRQHYVDRVMELEKKLEDFIKHHEKMCWDYTDRLNETHMKLEVAKDALKDARWAARVVIVFCNVLKKLDGNCRPFQKQKAEMILAKHKDKIESNENNKQGER